MRRMLYVLALAVVMTAMIVVGAAPVLASGSGGVVGINPVNHTVTVTHPTDPIREPRIIALPPNPISPPVQVHNPNVVSGECDLDVCPTP
jgi:hypothetical protein